jgi:hypothetical protein
LSLSNAIKQYCLNFLIPVIFEIQKGWIMNIYAEKTQENKFQSANSEAIQKKKSNNSAGYLIDNRPGAIAQRKLQEAIKNSRGISPIQKKANNTGLPDSLKTGVENLSGYTMDDVKVHYNSDKPAQLQAQAYAQGTDIHIAPGKEQHLPHEAWPVVQQKQGRVQPTIQMKGKVNVNDDDGLEKEADVMGNKVLQMQTAQKGNSQSFKVNPKQAKPQQFKEQLQLEVVHRPDLMNW